MQCRFLLATGAVVDLIPTLGRVLRASVVGAGDGDAGGGDGLEVDAVGGCGRCVVGDDGHLALRCEEQLLHRLLVVPLHPPASYWPILHTSHMAHSNPSLFCLLLMQYFPFLQLASAHGVGDGVVVGGGVGTGTHCALDVGVHALDGTWPPAHTVHLLHE